MKRIFLSALTLTSLLVGSSAMAQSWTDRSTNGAGNTAAGPTTPQERVEPNGNAGGNGG